MQNNKGNNKITELRTILQRESQNSWLYKQTVFSIRVTIEINASKHCNNSGIIRAIKNHCRNWLYTPSNCVIESLYFPSMPWEFWFVWWVSLLLTNNVFRFTLRRQSCALRITNVLYGIPEHAFCLFISEGSITYTKRVIYSLCGILIGMVSVSTQNTW
jgi:hypothetical protein